MGSSGGGDDGMGMMALMGQGTPMPGLPIAGQGPGTNAFEYGQFQNFLPDIKAEGENDMATGLRPDMFKYRSPSGVVAEGAGAGAGGSNSEIEALRSELAALQAGGGGGGNPPYGYSPFDNMSPGYSGQGGGGGRGGGIGTMGLGGGGFGPASNGVAPPANATQLPTPPGGWARGNVPGWPMGGPGTPRVMPAVNSDPGAAAAAAAANAASASPTTGDPVAAAQLKAQQQATLDAAAKLRVPGDQKIPGG